MLPADVEKWILSKDLPKIAASVKKLQVNGSTLAIIFDMLCRGDSSALAACKDLGSKSSAQSLEFLFHLRALCVETGGVTVYGPPFSGAKLQGMSGTQLEEWLGTKGQQKVGTSMNKQGLTGKGAAILLDMHNRSDSSILRTFSEFGSYSSVQTLAILYLIRELSTQ